MVFARLIILAVVAFIVVVGMAVVTMLARRSRFPVGAPRKTRETVHIVYGAKLIVDGNGYASDWRAAMLRQFDAAVEPDLDRVFDFCQFVAKHPEAEWADLISQRLDDQPSNVSDFTF